VVPLGDWLIDLDAAIEAALPARLALPGGGAVHIQPTRAAVMIDVDTGTPLSGSAEAGGLAANLNAARLIARELRLRSIGGGIVVDFVGLEGRRARNRVRETMESALQADPARPEVLGWTRLGHLELVRPRRGRPLAEALFDPDAAGSPKKHALALAHEALRATQREARARPAVNWRLVVTPAMHTALMGAASTALRALETRLARTIEIVVAEDGMTDFDIVAV
jgi:ribonuclease G